MTDDDKWKGPFSLSLFLWSLSLSLRFFPSLSVYLNLFLFFFTLFLSVLFVCYTNQISSMLPSHLLLSSVFFESYENFSSDFLLHFDKTSGSLMHTINIWDKWDKMNSSLAITQTHTHTLFLSRVLLGLTPPTPIIP